MKTTIKIALIAMTGMSFGVKAQLNVPENKIRFSEARGFDYDPSTDAIYYNDYNTGRVITLARGGHIEAKGNIVINSGTIGNHFKRKFDYNGGGWARTLIEYENSLMSSGNFRIGSYGGTTDYTYSYLGYGTYNDSKNFRLYPSGNAYFGSDIAVSGHYKSSRSSSNTFLRTDNTGYSGFGGGNSLGNGGNILLYGKDHATLPNFIKFRNGTGDKLVIDQNGDIGIGTSTPSEKLEIKNGSLKLSTNDATGNYELKFKANHDYNNKFTITSGNTVVFQEKVIPDVGGTSNSKSYLSNYYGIGFATNISNPTNKEQIDLYIAGAGSPNGSGNLGVGTTDPKSKLDVNGSIVVKNGHNLSWGNKYGEGIPTIAGNTSSGLHFYPNGSTLGATMQISKDGKTKFMNNIAVLGKIESREVKVSNTPTADFVFEEDYNLPSLESVDKHIKEKKHLPEIASAKEMKRDGVNIGDFQIQLLQKIEELTLYTIEQERKIKALEEQTKEIKELKALVNTLLQERK